ncbi:MAG: bifunctional diaminohydroxyphosphoribosylaminopyrimidine deaminase/5-amino-6-(5-phosphoribosylamino)uracil reductase RibD [Woeseiaceae bacterium]|nr:bifunctional diaminohydroxyphosphoribosylaminopyrimidine deaminase/5-amino-6-(5-phosphoribosylamino)uracil reductase RibD [Woeseiaceae bacterium]
MPEFTATDGAMMARALMLARRGRFTAHPNPMVGCVIARDGAVIGEGWHERDGRAHAEVNALRNAADAAGATVYVSLEPCAHHGRTPPCADALIDAGVARVVCAMQDPFPAVQGDGIARLKRAGIDVATGLLEAEAEQLNRGYLKRLRTGRPFVRAKLATSLDGAVAMRGGESQWITGPEARADVQRLRAESGAVLSGIGTVLADDPSFTVRDASLATGGRQPLRAIVDSRLRMPLSSRMLCQDGNTVVYCSEDGRRAALEEAGAEVVQVASDGDHVSLPDVLDDLGSRAINLLLVEAGPVLAGSLLAQRLVDELVIYQAPHIMGSETTSMFRTPAWQSLNDRRAVTITDVRRVGADTRLTATLAD